MGVPSTRARQASRIPSSASYVLEEFLKPAGETQAAFAARIGWTKARLDEFIRGKRGVTAAAALDLAEALGTTGKIWMNLQATWDLDVEAKRRYRAA
jgi:antitoxin HigA-1